MKNRLDLSVIIPLYNEEENISPLYSKLKSSLSRLKKTYEIILVDDGSVDKSLERLKAIQKRDSHVRIISFRGNFGQSAAISAGFSSGNGNIFIVMDADLQNDPDDISKLLGKLEEGYDVVSGWRYKREDPASKIIPSKISNWMHRKLTGINIHDSGCSLKAYKKEAVEGLELYGEMHRYIPALIAAKGFKIGEVKVEHHYRKFGNTKYGFLRIYGGFLDLLYVYFITKYSDKPLHFFGKWGLVQIIAGLILGIWRGADLFVKRVIYKIDVQFGSLLLLAVFLLITGTLFIMFGFLAELMIRAHFQNSKNKNYSIKEII